jgi:hypothetical protein
VGMKIPDGGLQKLTDKLMTAYGNTMVLKLFKNNITPASGDVAGTYTEADFAGYAASNCTGWTASTMASNTATTTADQKTFTRSSTGAVQNIYGYYVLDAGGNLLFAERDSAAPIPLTNLGDSYLVTPKWTLKSEF